MANQKQNSSEESRKSDTKSLHELIVELQGVVHYPPFPEIEVVEIRRQQQFFRGFRVLALVVSSIAGAAGLFSQIFSLLPSSMKYPALMSPGITVIFGTILGFIISGLVLRPRERG
jgi:hypothetical protein